MLVKHLNQFYEHTALRNASDKTLSNLKGQLQSFNRDFFFRNNDLKQIQSKDLSEYIIQKCEGKSIDLFKANVWALRQFFGYLVLKGILNFSPADVLRHAKYPNREKLPSYLRADEMRTLLDVSAKADNPADFLLISFLFVTGLRTSEVVGCYTSAYDREHGLIRVKVKGGWIREVPLTNAIMVVIDDYLHGRSDNNPHLFLTSREGKCSAAWVRKTLRRIGEEAELNEKLTNRLLRHTFATHAADRLGTDMAKALMGHSHSSTTQVYMHMSPARYRPITNRHPYASPVR
jgi:site-specific recombinase XerD